MDCIYMNITQNPFIKEHINMACRIYICARCAKEFMLDAWERHKTDDRTRLCYDLEIEVEEDDDNTTLKEEDDGDQ